MGFDTHSLPASLFHFKRVIIKLHIEDFYNK